MGSSAESAFVLWVTAHILLYHYEPQNWILWANAQILVLCYAPQHRISFEFDMNQISLKCIHMHMSMYPNAQGCVHRCKTVCTCACGHVSRWSYIHGHIAVYSHAKFDCALWAIAMNFIKHSRPWTRILSCVMTTFCYALWATAQNCWPQRSITQNSFKILPQPSLE
jgi:hypothetical protein